MTYSTACRLRLLAGGMEDMVDQLLRRALLYDFYGELLTERQKAVYEDFILNNFSLGEIAEDRGISRQGVYDLVKRCEKALDGYEEKLHLVERFLRTKSEAERLRVLAGQCRLTGEEKDWELLEQGFAQMLEHL